jgi:hypothetical protein
VIRTRCHALLKPSESQTFVVLFHLFFVCVRTFYRPFVVIHDLLLLLLVLVFLYLFFFRVVPFSNCVLITRFDSTPIYSISTLC